MESDRDCGVAAACDQRVTTVTRPASRDLRAKAVGNQPAKNWRVKEVLRPPVSSSDEVSKNLDECSLNNSDEEWVGTSSDASSAVSCGSRSKQVRYGTSASPQTAAIDSSEESDGIQAAPPRRYAFESWGDLEEFLKSYGAETYQSFRVRTNNKVTERNKKIQESGSKAPLVPDEWIYYARTYICTHGGNTNQKAKARGSASIRELCSVAHRWVRVGVVGHSWINACVQMVDPSGQKFALKLTSVRLEHNHPLTKHTHRRYPQTRTAYEPEVLSTVDELRKAGAKKKSILAYIHDHSACEPTKKDVHNLVAKLKKEAHTAPTSAKRLKRWMIEFTEEPGNVGRIFVDKVQDKRIATCITLQTKHMRALFDKFPEVLMIDATHGTNASKYKVFSIMAHDAFGKGQFVQHAVVQNERRNTLLTALEEFKRNNPVWDRIKCILIDKDFTEMSVLKVVFPEAIVLLCQFHVLKYLREEIASAEYGFTSWQKQQLQGLVNLLVYAKTEREYERFRKYLRHIMTIGRGSVTRTELGAGSTELGDRGTGTAEDAQDVGHPFEAYFSKNWDSCRYMWCSFERQNAVTMGNNTNNRIEASWKQVKELVNGYMGVDECIAAIMCYQAQSEREFMDALYNLRLVHNPKYDREMQFLSNLVSEHACELVYDQYVYAITRANYSFYEPVPDVIMIQNLSEEEEALDEPRSEYSVTKRNWSCSCLFMTSRLLPCRHVFFVRKALNCENILPTQLLNPRWLLASLRSDSAFEVVTSEPFSIGRVLPEASTVWDSNRKFREAHLVATTISEHMSGMGMIEYKLAMEALRSVATLFKHGEFDAIPAADPVHDKSAPIGNREEFSRDNCSAGTNSNTHVDPASRSSSEVAQPDRELVQSGTELTQLVRSGTELDQSVQLGTESTQSAPSGAEVVEVANSVNLDEGEAEFELQSPPKAKGRPKQKPKAVKAKRKLHIAMVQEDLEMHDKQLNLISAFELLSDNVTFDSAQENILMFKLFVFATKPKPPIAHDLRKLPATKPLMRPDEIVRIFPMDLIRKCGAKVSAFQRKNRGIRELDIALEIVGVGVFVNSSIKLMQKWHVAAAAFRRIARALAWIENLDLSNCGNASYSIEEDPALPSKLRQIEVLTPQMDVLALAGKELITDEVMYKILAKLFGCKPNIAVFDSSTLGIVVGGSVNTSSEIIREALSGLTTEKVLIPVNCNGNHWCAIMMDLEGGVIYVYDSSSSSYVVNVRAVAQTMVVLLPPGAQKAFRVRVFDAGLGVQTDSYNCGIYVLLAFEMFCGAEPLGHVDKKMLQCLR